MTIGHKVSDGLAVAQPEVNCLDVIIMGKDQNRVLVIFVRCVIILSRRLFLRFWYGTDRNS